MRRFYAFVFSILVLLLLAPPSRGADPLATAASEGARLVFLLQYVGTDYAGAVQDGKIVSESEYGEVLRFARELIREYSLGGLPADSVSTGLRQLEEKILQLAPAAEVLAKTRELVPGLSRAVGATARPAATPDHESGARLWRRDCAACHGAIGAGDGYAASGMEPRPAALRDQLEPLTPRQVHGAVTFGIEGTAMPSFQGAYDDGETWDVSFFVMTLRAGFAPRPPPAGTQLGLEELASSTNAELLTKLRRARPEASPAEVDFLRQSRASSSSTTPAVSAAAPRGGAEALEEAFAGAAQRMLPAVVGVSGYVRDPDWQPEKLRTDKGEGWIQANAEALRYPGFRPVRFGSGFVVDAEGYVLSSNQLVRDERGEVVSFADVEMQDGGHTAANVVGTEPTLDLAVLRIFEPKRIAQAAQSVELADGDLQVGRWLIAVGDPPGPEKILTVGVVAAPPSQQCYQEQLTATLVQSSLSIPAGGLGGPVLDLQGRVVGIAVEPRITASLSLSPETSPSARVLPIKLAANLFEALKVAQSHRSPWIGVSVLELNLARQRLGKNVSASTFPRTGVAIDDVFDPSPASSAGVRPGDFLVALGGHKLFAVSDFQKWLYVLGVGARVELELQRDGQPLRVTVAIEARPEAATTR